MAFIHQLGLCGFEKKPQLICDTSHNGGESLIIIVPQNSDKSCVFEYISSSSSLKRVDKNESLKQK